MESEVVLQVWERMIWVWEHDIGSSFKMWTWDQVNLGIKVWSLQLSSGSGFLCGSKMWVCDHDIGSGIKVWVWNPVNLI